VTRHDPADEIRWAHEMREVALEVTQLLREVVPAFPVKAKLAEPTDTVAKRLRTELGLDPAAIWRTADFYEAYRVRRTALEVGGVLCFQITGVDVDEARGFSIDLRPLPVVAVNAADAVAARMFTLLHEATHLALGAAGACDMHTRGAEERDRIEVYCNAVAAEVLVPSDSLRAEAPVRGVRGEVEWPDDTVRALATRYVIVRRFLDLGLASANVFPTVH
jgi:Zn-dependent peptidase ImmA (M78 family)